MKVLCSSLLFLLLAGAAAGANTPGEALDTYYRLSQGEDHRHRFHGTGGAAGPPGCDFHPVAAF